MRQTLLRMISVYSRGEIRVLRRLGRPNFVTADLFDALRQVLAKDPHMGLAQYMPVVKINLVNLNSTLTSLAPTHLRIVDIVERLFRALE